MTDWTSGYVAELGYPHCFNRELTPTILDFVTLVRGIRAPDMEGPIAYCELGCGQGFSANLLAAANPQVDFHATDFNPTHVVGARALAAAAATPNLHFYDRSFAEFLDQPGLPAFDVIALHGIYSWISAENRGIIVDIIRRTLKPGGLCYISYNTLPGWAAVLPLRRLLVEHAATEAGSIAPRIERALTFAKRLIDTNPAYARINPGIPERLKAILSENRIYLAHEYFNRDWTPLYHADVVADMAQAKLTYVGSAHLLEDVDFINFTSDQLSLLAEVSDTTLQETLRDYMVNRQFRRDVFIKGTVPLSFPEVRERWFNTRFALSTRRADVPLKVTSAQGEASLREDIYAPVLDTLAAGPRTMRQMFTANPKIADFGWAQIQQVLMVLTGSGHLQPCLDAKGDAKRAQRTKAFNAAVMERAKASDDLKALASPVTGGGIPVARFCQLFLLGRQAKAADPAKFAWDILSGNGQSLSKEGRVLETPEDNIAELQKQFKDFNEKQVPMLQQMGIA